MSKQLHRGSYKTNQLMNVHDAGTKKCRGLVDPGVTGYISVLWEFGFEDPVRKSL